MFVAKLQRLNGCSRNHYNVSTFERMKQSKLESCKFELLNTELLFITALGTGRAEQWEDSAASRQQNMSWKDLQFIISHQVPFCYHLFTFWHWQTKTEKRENISAFQQPPPKTLWKDSYSLLSPHAEAVNQVDSVLAKSPLEFLRSKTWICLFAGCCRCVAECRRHDFSWFGNNFFKIDADRKGLKGKSQNLNINAFHQPPNPVWILFLKFAEHRRRIIRLHGVNCCSKPKCVVSFVDMNHKDQTCDFACKGSFSAGMISGDSVIVSSSCFTDRQSLQIVTLPDKRGKAREYQRFPTAAKNFVKGFLQFSQPSRRSRQSGWFGSCKEPLEFLRSKTWICLFAGCCRCVAECCRHDFSWFGNNFFKIDADRKGLKGKSQKNINAFQQPPNPVWILFLKFAEHPRRIIRLHGFNCCSKPKFRAKWRGSVLLQGQ